MNQFNYGFEQQNTELLESVTHLRDAMLDLGLELPFGCVLDETTEVDTLTAYKQDFEAAVQAELKAKEEAAEIERWRRSRPPCYIGPYNGRICVICGRRDPSCPE